MISKAIDTLAHFLVPRQSNNHRAKLIHSSSLVVLMFVFVFLQIAFRTVSPKNPQVLGYAANISTSEVERLTNIQRTNNGLSALTDNPVLDSAAKEKGKDMLAKGYWAHVAPDGKEPWAFFVSAHYDYRYAGENLARDFSNAESAVNAWMASPTHRENMLSPNYKEIGIGVVEGQLAGVDTTIIVQFFGTKITDTVTVQPIAAVKTSFPSPTPIPAVALATPSPSLIPQKALIAGSLVSQFDFTRYLSLGLVGTLILVVAVDGFLINKRKIFRIAGHWVAHLAFLGMILAIVIIAKAGRII